MLGTSTRRVGYYSCVVNMSNMLEDPLLWSVPKPVILGLFLDVVVHECSYFLFCGGKAQEASATDFRQFFFFISLPMADM